MPHIISTVNVNGIRAAVRKGLLQWLDGTAADAICLQETRATDAETHKALASALDAGWHLATAEPEAKGRSGVAILSRHAPDTVRIGYGDDEFARAGRYLEADFGELTIGSVYVPSGDVGTERQDEKIRFMASFGDYLRAAAAAAKAAGRDLVVCGDWNIAPTELDLKNWRANQRSSGFLPEEREWLDGLVGTDAPLTDVVRQLHPEISGPYSWWSYRGRAFDNDAGWRIDYHLVTDAVAQRAKQAQVERADSYDQRWSDHAPVTVQYR